MICVGIVSAILGRRAVWTVPTAFVVAMAIGGIFGLHDMIIRRAEIVIATSLIALGLTIASGGRVSKAGRPMPIWLAILFVMGFGAAHGNAHGVEIPATANPIAFTIGFLVGTAGLHLVGVFGGLSAVRHPWSMIAIRLSGMFTAAMGVGLLAR